MAPRTGTPKALAMPAFMAALADPRLEGAACTGRAPLFDDYVAGETPQQQGDRLAVAARFCRGCPVQAGCETAATEHQATGMWAGRLHQPPASFKSEPLKRARKAA